MASYPAALLIAIPTSLDEFVASVTNGSDYGRRYADDPRGRWSAPRGYRENVADPTNKLCDLADRLGLNVIREATLESLRVATQLSAIVVLVAHWKGAQVTPTDLLVDGPSIADALRDQTDTDLLRLRKISRSARSRSELAAMLNATVQQWGDRMLREAKRSRGVDRFVMMPQTARARARLALDAVLTGCLRPGERLELADGMHGAVDVAEAVSPDFAGVLDLTTCTSMILADQLDKLRKSAFRCVQFEQPLPPSIATLTLCQTLATTDWTPDAYLAARKRAIEDVESAISAEAKIALRRTSWFRWLRCSKQECT